MRPIRWMPLLLVAALAAGGCSDDSEPAPVSTPAPSPSLTPTPTPTVTTAATCPNQDDVAITGRSLGDLTGDVDGDGSTDRVELRVDVTAELGCQAFVVAHTSAGQVVDAIAGFNPELGLPQPHLNSIVQIDGEGGKEIVVDLAAGASTQFVGAFSFRDGELEMLRPAGERSDFGPDLFLFGYGGSVGHLDAVDCSEKEGADVVMTSAIPKGNGYRIERRFFVAGEGGTLVEDESLAESQVVSLNEFGATGYFDGAPFASCPP